jgi:hypothetical protein
VGVKGGLSLEARKAKAKIVKQMAGVDHTDILFSKRMANWLRIKGQFRMGAVRQERLFVYSDCIPLLTLPWSS